jgi:hypothetical protein
MRMRLTRDNIGSRQSGNLLDNDPELTGMNLLLWGKLGSGQCLLMCWMPDQCSVLVSP